MTVAELITVLKSFEPWLPIFTRDGENGDHLIVHATANYQTGCCGMPAVLLLGRYQYNSVPPNLQLQGNYEEGKL